MLAMGVSRRAADAHDAVPFCWLAVRRGLLMLMMQSCLSNWGLGVRRRAADAHEAVPSLWLGVTSTAADAHDAVPSIWLGVTSTDDDAHDVVPAHCLGVRRRAANAHDEVPFLCLDVKTRSSRDPKNQAACVFFHGAACSGVSSSLPRLNPASDSLDRPQPVHSPSSPVLPSVHGPCFHSSNVLAAQSPPNLTSTDCPRSRTLPSLPPTPSPNHPSPSRAHRAVPNETAPVHEAILAPHPLEKTKREPDPQRVLEKKLMLLTMLMTQSPPAGWASEGGLLMLVMLMMQSPSPWLNVIRRVANAHDAHDAVSSG